MSWEQLLPQANTKMTTLSDFYQPQQGDNELKVLHAADLLDQRQARQIQMKVAKLQFDTSVEHLEGTKALSAIAKPQQTSPDDIKTAVGYVPKAQYMSWAAMYKGEAANQQQEAMTAATQAATALQAGRMQYMIHQGISPDQVGLDFGSPQSPSSPQGQDASTNVAAMPQMNPMTPTSINAMSPDQTRQRVGQIAQNLNPPTRPANLDNNGQSYGTDKFNLQLTSENVQKLRPLTVTQATQELIRMGVPANQAGLVAHDLKANNIIKGSQQATDTSTGTPGQPSGQSSGRSSIRDSQAQQFVSKIVAANGDIEKLRKLRNDPIAMSTWGGKKLNDAINDAWKGGKGETGAQEKAEFLKLRTKANMGQKLTLEEQARHDAYKQEREIAPQAGFGFGDGQTPQTFDKWTDKEKKFWYDAWVADPAGTKAILPIDYRDRAGMQAFGKGVADYQTDKGVSGRDTVVGKQVMKSDSAALKQLTEREALVNTFTTRISANTKVVKDAYVAYDKYKDNPRFVNAGRNMWNKFMGSGELAALKLALYSLEQEVGKVEKASIGVAGLDVEASKVMDSIHDPALSLKDAMKVLDMGVKLGGTATAALKKQREDLVGKMKSEGEETKLPKTGDVIKGYKFKGGDPSKKENWEKV